MAKTMTNYTRWCKRCSTKFETSRKFRRICSECNKRSYY